jgi:hypothetical protein
MPSAWFRRNVFHPCEGGPLLRANYLATLIRPMSMPSLRSSPSILALPTTVGDAHLADQPTNFRRCSRSAAAVRRFATPTQSETDAVPTDRGILLHNRQRLDGILHQRYRPTKIRRSVTLKAISPAGAVAGCQVDGEGSGPQLPTTAAPGTKTSTDQTMLQASLIRQKHCAIQPHVPAGLGFRQRQHEFC